MSAGSWNKLHVLQILKRYFTSVIHPWVCSIVLLHWNAAEWDLYIPLPKIYQKYCHLNYLLNAPIYFKIDLVLTWKNGTKTSQNTEPENFSCYSCFIFTSMHSPVGLEWLMTLNICHTEIADAGDSHNICMQIYLPVRCQWFGIIKYSRKGSGIVCLKQYGHLA